MTGLAIREFMWPFQPHFRLDSEHFINDALLAIGLPAAPTVLLIGFREEGATPNPICVEPEDGSFSSALFKDSLARADEIFTAHSDRTMFTTDPALQARRTQQSLENARRKTIETTLNASANGADKYFFAGAPQRVADYRVYPVVTVLRTRWDSAPALPSEILPGIVRAGQRNNPQSLQHAVVRAALGEMTLALALSPEPQGLRTWASDLVPETLRQAANSFVLGLVTAYGNEYGGDLFNAMNAVSAQPYEGRTGVGTLLLSRPSAGLVDKDIEFRKGIRVSETRALRKALEMTGPELALLTDGIEALGLGRPRSQDSLDGVFELTVTGRGEWSFGAVGLKLLTAKNGSPSLPRDRISEAKFLETVDRVFGTAGDGPALWALTEAASEQQHGTMLVVHADAEVEAERLSAQALVIAPRTLSEGSLSSLTAIDGAILVAPDAKCHAVGVILDGYAAGGIGDASRGARFNSAVRYHHGSANNATMIVIVSEDGMIDLLPNLRRRLKRASVSRAIDDLVRASQEPVDFAAAWAHESHVRSLDFYLSEEQAIAANAAFEAVEEARERAVSASGGSGITRIGYEKLRADPEMNESYFLD